MPMPVSPSTSPGETAKKAKRDELKKLDVKRRALESEAAVIVDELMATPEDGEGAPMGVDTPLTDVDGYPRADIDVFRARALRHRLNEIRTDHKGLMKQIESDMAKVATFSKHVPEDDEEERKKRLAPKPKPKFDPATGKWVVMNWDGTVAGVEHGEERAFDRIGSAEGEEAAAALTATQQTTSPPSAPTLVPFAVIDGVADDSPAKTAGLVEGDLVVQFGSVNHLNHKNLKAILDLVPSAAADRTEIPITVLRREQPSSVEPDLEHNVEAVVRKRVIVKILPRPWSGRGLLGCHIKGYAETTSDNPAESS